MSSQYGLPPLIKADNRRIIGWRYLRELLSSKSDQQKSRLSVFENCSDLIRCLPALLHDRKNPEDASGEPHSITHLPEALRYGVMAFMPSSEASVKYTFKDTDDFFSSEKSSNSINTFLRFS